MSTMRIDRKCSLLFQPKPESRNLKGSTEKNINQNSQLNQGQHAENQKMFYQHYIYSLDRLLLFHLIFFTINIQIRLLDGINQLSLLNLQSRSNTNNQPCNYGFNVKHIQQSPSSIELVIVHLCMASKDLIQFYTSAN